jgi:hypothetical protein
LIRKIARFSRITLAVLAIVGLLALTLVGLMGERYLKTQIQSRLVTALNRQVTIGGFSVNLASRVVELRDVLIPGLPRSKRPSLVAPRIRLALSFRSLFTSHILLRGLEIDQPSVSIEVFPDGSTDFPQGAPSQGPSSRQVSIGKLTIRTGNLFLNDQQIPLEIDLPNFEAALVADPKSLLAGEVSAGPGPMRFGDLPAQDARLELGIRFADSTLFVDRGLFTAAATKLSVAGELDLHAEPQGVFRLNGPFDLETFDRSVAATGLALKGVAQAKAIVSIERGKLSVSGTLRGQDGSYASLPVDVFSTSIAWDGSNLRLKDLALETLSGKAVLAVESLKGAPTTVKGTLDRVNAEPLVRWLFGYGAFGLGARVSGPIDLSFPRGESRFLSGTGDLVFTADPSKGDPLSGRFPFKADRGVITMNNVQLETVRTAATIDGSLWPDKRLSLDVRLVSEDLAATDALGIRLRTALGTTGAEPLGAKGRGTFHGRVTGTTTAPLASGRFVGTNVAYLGVLWGDLDWEGSASALVLKSDALVAVRGASRVEMSGVQRLGALGVDDALDLSIRVKDWPAKDLLHIVDSELDVDSIVSGTLTLLGTRAKPLGQANLVSVSGLASGMAFTNADLKLRFEGEALRVESLKATMGGGELRVKGLLTDEAEGQAFSGEVEVIDAEISDLGLQDPSVPQIGGHITGRATLGGPIARPRIAAHIESKRIFYGDEGVGAMTLDVNGAGDGILNITAQSDSPRFSADVTGTIEAKAPHMSRLEVKLANARVDPVLRALGSRFENAIAITASAVAHVEGPLSDPDRITAQVREGRMRIALPDYSIETAPGFVIDVEKREVRIAGLILQGEGTSLNISGKLAMRPDDINDLAVTGRADLRVLSGFLREWRLRGAATFRSQVGGTRRAMRVSGGLDIEDGSVRLRAFPQGLDDLNGRLVFNETQARVAGLEGRFGGGRVSVSGQIGFGGAVPPSFDFSLVGDSLGLRYPEGLRSTFGARLRLQGTTDSHWLTGDLQVAKALWSRKYEITSELLGTTGSSTTFSRAATTFRPSPMHLDIAIKAPGTLRLDNNLASLAAKADLTLTGSPTEPQLMGRVEVERGKVFFRGNTYEVRKGVAQFSNPREINPVFDIEADTRLRSYRLTLQANGTLDRVSTRITSDPPLTGPQIASLLTGGDESQVADLAGSNTDIKTLGTGGVNTLASSWLADNLTGKVAQGFGLSRLSIDPGNQGLLSASSARLTVGKRVARDLEVVYSRTIRGGAEDQLATVEYSLTNRFSLVVSWEEREGFAADVRTRFVLGRR